MYNEATRVMQFRAITTEQKRDLVMRLLSVWLNVPELRLGQLLVNGLDNLVPEHDKSHHLFNIEDEILIQLLESTFPERK